MKNIIISTVAAVMVAFGIGIFVTGCDELPSEEKIEMLSKSIGVAAGCAVDLSGVSDKDRNAILEVLDIVDDVVPAPNESFATAWKPVIDNTVQKLVDEGKLDVRAGELVKSALYVAAQGLDYVFDVRWPRAKDYKNLISAGIRGFTEGFKNVVKPANVLTAAKFDYDVDEYNKAEAWFKANLKK